jgi:hypothetical protein
MPPTVRLSRLNGELVMAPSFVALASFGSLFLFAAPGFVDNPGPGKLARLSVFPNSIELVGPRAEHRLGVLGEFADGKPRDLSRDCVYSSDLPAIASVDARGVVHPVADGSATITVHALGQTGTVQVQVKGLAADVPVGFSREVVPILTRAGCNAGACHGAQHGRGGFRLSLFGFDPAFDQKEIVQSAEGRRVVPSDPERSILLLKPTLQMEHAGGERLTTNSRDYAILKYWLEDGAPAPDAKDANVTAISMWPPKRTMVPGELQQLLVQATWSDGRVEDVTAHARFDALNESVAAVTPAGLVTAKGQGETYVMVRFMGQANVAAILLPYSATPVPVEAPDGNFIDSKLAAKWRDLGLVPSPGCSDEEFFRRLHLDAIGTLPAPADIRAFLKDTDPKKRAKAVDRVLDRPEFVDFWALKWGDLLRINRDLLQDKGMWSFHNWVRASLRDNKPVDEMVREMITAQGSTATEGAANYFVVSNGSADWAETTAQLFLGVRMQCAKCHHHPFERWSQDDYAGLAAFFVRLGTKSSQEFGIFGNERVIFLRPGGEQSHPRTGRIVAPHPLDGPTMEDETDRRRRLAEWLTEPGNPYFARNMVNRFWAYVMGHGIVEPIDDLRATNPPSNAPLLDALASDFAANKFDLKHLLRMIFTSRAYQRSANAAPGNQADAANTYFTRFTRRRLTAEQLADAIDFATGTREKYQGVPLGTRAIQLPDTKVRSFLMDVFGRPARQVTCECERTTQPNIAQALHLLNSTFLNRKIDDPKGRIATLLKDKTPAANLIEQMYLTTLSRPPRSEEVARATKWLATAATPKDGAADLLWVLLNSREFLFNH